MKKVIYFDTETSGLDPIQNDILTIGGIIEIDGEVKEEFYLEMQPFNYNTISDYALQVNGLTREQIKTFMTPQEGYRKLITIFSKYVNKYDKNDKLTPIGYNVKFDIDFLNQLFVKNGDKYFGSFVDYHYIDPMVLINFLRFKGVIKLENCKLVTASAHYGIELDAHNAMNDIIATKELLNKLMERLEYKEK